MKQIRPLFISPLIYDEENINARINSALISSLPINYFPVVLCEGNIGSRDRTNILTVKRSLFDRVRLKVLLKATEQEICYLPDTYYYYWYKKALAMAEEYLKTNSIDYIHSFSYPYTSHLVALELKKKYNIPWIAHFYEPWSDNLFRMVSQKVIDRNIYWEKDVVNAADIIIHNSEIMCDSWKTRYYDNKKFCKKILSLPMAFDFKGSPSDRPLKGSGNQLHITHVGNFYGLRKAYHFFLAIDELIKEIPQIKCQLKITLVGDVLQDDIDFAQKHNFLDVIDVVGRKTEEECIPYYKESDLFIVIESEQQGPLFFPSKLIRYYFYNRPILGITSSQSVLYDELKKTGHHAFCPSDTEGIKNYLKMALFNYDSLLNYNSDTWKRFESKNVVDSYLMILRERILEKI